MKLMRNVACAGVAALALGVFAQPARAYTATANLTVTASVISSCTVTAATLAFGNYISNGAALDQTASISVTCGVPFVLAMGTGGSGSQTARTMSSGGPTPTTLDYNLYTDSAHTNVWYGPTTCGSPGGSSSNCEYGTSSTTSLTIYGEIAATQSPGTGNYSDSVIMTMTY